MDEDYQIISGVITLIGAGVLTAGVFLEIPWLVSTAVMGMSGILAGLEWVSENSAKISIAGWVLVFISGLVSLIGHVTSAPTGIVQKALFGLIVVLALVMIADGIGFGSSDSAGN